MSEELMAWDLFKWIVVTLLTANCLLIAGLYGGIRSDVAELKQDRITYAKEIEDTRTAVGKDIADTRAGVSKEIADARVGLAQAISEIRVGVGEEAAKTNAKLDALIEQSQKPRESGTASGSLSAPRKKKSTQP
jgi:hypothetical protein